MSENRSLADVKRGIANSPGYCRRCGVRCDENQVQLIVAVRAGKSPDHNGAGKTIVSKTLKVCEPCAVAALDFAISGADQ